MGWCEGPGHENMDSRTQEWLSRDLRRAIRQLASIDFSKTWTELKLGLFPRPAEAPQQMRLDLKGARSEGAACSLRESVSRTRTSQKRLPHGGTPAGRQGGLERHRKGAMDVSWLEDEDGEG